MADQAVGPSVEQVLAVWLDALEHRAVDERSIGSKRPCGDDTPPAAR